MFAVITLFRVPLSHVADSVGVRAEDLSFLSWLKECDGERWQCLNISVSASCFQLVGRNLVYPPLLISESLCHRANWLYFFFSCHVGCDSEKNTFEIIDSFVLKKYFL